MSNPHRGEVDLKAGKEKYTLHFSINAICELEEAAGVSFSEFLDQGEGLGLRGMRLLVWAGLLDKHEDVTLKMAGDIAQKAGIVVATEKAMEAFLAAFPDADGEAESLKNPPKAKAKQTG